MVEYETARRSDPRTLICKVVVAVVSAALVIMINYGVFSSECTPDDGCTLKAYHPLFMSLGFLFFMTSAILSYIGAGDRVLARRVHVILQCIAFVCSGLFAVFFREAHDESHWQLILSFFLSFSLSFFLSFSLRTTLTVIIGEVSV